MDNAPGRHEDDFHVKPERPVLDIPDVMFYPFLHESRVFGLTPVSGDLCPAGDAGLGEMPYHVFVYQFGIEFRVIDHVGTRPDDAHVPPQDIEELGKLVQIGLAHEIAERELARVIFGCLRRVRLIVDVHAAELVTPEAGSVQSGPFLSEEHRAWTLQLYAEGNDRDERQKGGCIPGN